MWEEHVPLYLIGFSLGTIAVPLCFALRIPTRAANMTKRCRRFMTACSGLDWSGTKGPGRVAGLDPISRADATRSINNTCSDVGTKGTSMTMLEHSSFGCRE